MTNSTKSKSDTKPLAGTQTLARGLEVISAVSNGHTTLTELTEVLNLTRSTAHRLASTLVEHRYLTQQYREGYSLGPKLLELGYAARQAMSLPRIAREHLVTLSQETGDTVHLGVLEGFQALYLEKVPGRRRVEISSRVGERQPLRSTGLGKALLLDGNKKEWTEAYNHEEQLNNRYNVDLGEWLERMQSYARTGAALDLEENEDRIRCVAAPIRDVSGGIVAAISLSSAAQYMDDDRMQRLIQVTINTANNISADLGYNVPS